MRPINNKIIQDDEDQTKADAVFAQTLVCQFPKFREAAESC